MADSPTIERRSKEAEAAVTDPIMREPVVLWMAEKVAGIDPYEAAPHIRSSLDAIAGAESSGGRNTTGVADKNTGNRALGNYQWFPTPFKEDLEALDIYLRKAAGVDKKDWKTPAWIAEAIEHRDPRKLSDHKQDLIQMARITRLADNDDIAKMWMGDIPALRDFYAILHHTQGYEDEATLRQMDRYMPLPDPEPEPAESIREPAASALARRTEQEYATPDLTTPINAGMLSEVVDLPSRRGGGEILNEAVVPQRSGRFPEVSVPQRGGRIPEISVPQRGGRFPEVSVDARRRSGAEILSEQQAISSRVDPTLPPVPPRGQAEPRLESELAATQMATQNGRFSEINVTTPRVDETPPRIPEVSQVASVPATSLGDLEIDDDPVVAEVPATKLDNLTVHQSYERRELPAAKEDIREQLRASMPEPETREDRLNAIRDSLPDPSIPEGYEPTSSAARQIRRGVDTIAMGASLGAYDEIAGLLAEAGINGADGSYEETVNRIRQNVADQRAVSPRVALLQELGGGLFTAGGITRGLINQGVGAGKAGFAEGAFTGLAYGDTPDERLGGALGLGAVGGTLGGAIGWATNRSRKLDRATVEGARIPDDDVLDDEILTATIKNDVVPGNKVTYVTRSGAKKEVEVVAINDGYVAVKDGANQYAVPYNRIETVSFSAGRSPQGALKDAEKAGQYDWVRAGPGGLYQQKQFSYLEEAPYQASNRTQRPKVLRPKLDKDGNPSIMPSGKAEWEMQDLTWRNAKTAGQFFDGVKFGMRNFYDQKLTPASDYVMREVAPRVGAIFQRYSESALRNNTIAFKTIMEPMEKLIKSMDEDKVLKAMMMDYTNMKNLQRWNREVAEVRAAPTVQLKGPGEQTITTLGDLLDYIRKNYGDEQAIAFSRYLSWNKGIKADHVQRLSGVDAFLDDVAHHIHTRKKRKNPDEEPKDIIEELARYKDDAREARTRLSMVDDLRNGQPVDKVDQYFNPLLTDFRRTSNYEVLNQMSRLFNLKKPGRGQDVQPTDLFDELYRTLITRGIAPQQAKKAMTAMKDDFIGQAKTPNNWLQFLNSWGYAGSLAGPKSALLNFHDVPMAAVIYGPDSFKGLFKKMGYKVEDKGVVQRVGEFQNYVNEQMSLGARDLSKQFADTARKGTDVLMKYSAFGWADAVGKQKITQMIIQDAVDNVDSLGARWGFYFSRSELDQIAKQIRKHGTDVGSYTGRGKDLMEELFFAGLGQQQLISSAGRPLAWSRNPNLRFMWALRGFAMKQLALAHRNIIDNIAQGNKEAAWDYMKRYALFSAGAFGLLNEGRQWMWGDGEFTAGGVLMSMADQIVSTASINTIGLNDYQWGKMMQEGVPITFIKSLEPLMTSVPRNNLMDVVQALDGEFKNNDSLNAGQRLLLPPSQFPLIKQWSNAVENVEEDFGIAPDPMAQFNRVYLQQEKVDG